MAKKKNKQGTLKSMATPTILGKVSSAPSTISALGTLQAAANNTSTKPTTYNTAYHKTYQATSPTQIGAYQQSQAVTDAENRYNGYLNGENRPDYTSKYADTIAALADKIANRKEFSYDFNADPLYQNYKDQYTRQAQLGQANAMGQAAALTGGYGNSYAATAGNLAYQENMSHLNDVIPELYNAAMNKYNQDLSNQRADLSMYQGLEDTDYGRYRDSVADYNTDRDFYSQDYYNKYNQDYGQYRDTVADTQWTDSYNQQENANAQNYNSQEHWNNKNYNYQEKRAKVEDKHWTKEFKENQRQFNKNYELSKKGRASGGSGGGGRRSYGSGRSSHLTKDQAGIYGAIRKFKNGNSTQGEIAWNTINRLGKQYKLSDSQMNYLYYDYLGYGSAPDHKTKGESGEVRNNSKKQKLQTWDDVPGKYQSKVMTAQEYSRSVQENHGKSKYKNYQAYLKAMGKKYGF
jgi:hypothetical protein